MNSDAIREWLNRQPFEQFVLRTSNGDVYEVRHPETLALGKNRAVHVDPKTDRAIFIALIHVNAIEALQPA